MMPRLLAIVLLTMPLGQRPMVERPSTARRSPADVTPIPADVLKAESEWADKDTLLAFLAVPEPSPYAIRAVGRLEDPSVVPRLIPLLNAAPLRRATAAAIAQSLKGFDPQRDPDLVHLVAERFRSIASDADLIRVAGPVVESMGRVAYASPTDVAALERTLVTVVNRSAADLSLASIHSSALRSLEWLYRLNGKIVSPRPDTIAALDSVVAGTRTNDTGAAQADAFAALLAAKALDAESEKTALSSDEAELRRMAAAVLAGSGAGLDADARNRLVLEALHDASPTVRYEALRAYVRHVATTRGCDPILQAMQDEASFVSLAAVDALEQLCLDDEGITTRIVAESRPPPTTGSWTRQAHAFVTLAKRSPDRASISMAAFSFHQIWQVRMYAARAAASLNDVATLEKLAYDDNDNVREAALRSAADARETGRGRGNRCRSWPARLPARAERGGPAQGEPGESHAGAAPRGRVEAPHRGEERNVPRHPVGPAGRARDSRHRARRRGAGASSSGLRSGHRHTRRNDPVQVDRQHGCCGAATPSRLELGHCRASLCVAQSQEGWRVPDVDGRRVGTDHGPSLPRAGASRSLLRRPDLPPRRAQLRHPGRQSRGERILGARPPSCATRSAR